MAYSFGMLYLNKRFTKATMTVFGPGGWSGVNGLMISAPARTRRQALKLSNVLLTEADALVPGHPLT